MLGQRLKTRLQFYMNRQSLLQIERLKTSLRITSDIDFFRYTIALLRYLASQQEQGATIHCLNRNGYRSVLNVFESHPDVFRLRKAGGVERGRRFQLDLTTEGMEELKALVRSLGFPSQAALFRHSLMVLSFVADKIMAGGQLGMALNGTNYIIPLIGLERHKAFDPVHRFRSRSRRTRDWMRLTRNS